ncbi:Rid family hydrolase [Ruegeria faecimaris]|uniref:Enamine deaminase RidA, house cleaning of reactive enamine intermediates, YjgF/YER057c/UK114 family n=1 Tax=Ruegeria faecimaris TaxID=686389 RepID=A0A521DZU9_9RHOB|nr:Rid family hydrolase [Ruegeria faecimaris]SMO77243.1 Enamine deaminase RidA, house cleaning of reactive enamine intermediates, YjgF/YER057c/UK114 family [Ruegeria faecimaris]
MTIRRISSGGQYEAKVGYCRAVVANGFVFVAGTCAQGEIIPKDIVGQCKSALQAIEKALDEAGSNLAHVVRVNYYLPDMSEFELCWPLLVEAFGENPPAATVTECNLITPEDRIEIEVTAVLPD